MMLQKIISFTACLAFLVSCQTTEPPSSTSPKNFTNVFETQDRNFALPPGNWTLVSQDRLKVGGNHSAEQNFSLLISVTENVVDRVIISWVQRKYNKWREHWSQYPSCQTTSKENVFHSVIVQNTGSAQWKVGNKVNCWHIRTFSLGTNGSELSILEDLRAYAKQNNLYLPATLLGVRYAQNPMSDRRDYIEYLWNPDILLPKSEGAWRPADWTTKSVAQDPGKNAVIQQLKNWAVRWRQKYPMASAPNL